MESSVHATQYISRYQTEFENEKCIGRGGFGVVFQAKNKVDDQRYAVKRIKLKNSDRAKVMREVRALAKLEHANIVRYHQAWLEQPPVDWQQQDEIHTSSDPSIYTASSSSSSSSQDSTDQPRTGLPQDKQYLYIQMQLCDQETLKDWLQKNILNRCSCHLMDVFHQIVDAVGYVHQSGLMHRDLKPSNIFFAPCGRVKVGDFGLARTLEEQTDGNPCDHGYCEHTAHVGTTLYMSPEQIEKRTYSYKVDIYSLGLILVELFCPFSTEMERVQTLIDAKKHIFAPHLHKSISNDVGFILKVLSRTPDSRPTADEILNHKFSCKFMAKEMYLGNQKSGRLYDYISRYNREFEHIEELGKGDYGKVLEARCKLDEKIYAIKRISMFGFLEREWEEGQLARVEQLRQLEHPHICTYYGAWYDHPPPGWTKEDEEKDNFYLDKISYTLVTLIVHHLHIQTELCNRDTLRQWMTDNTTRNKLQILHMFYQMMSALSYIHKSSLIHANLKPSNILFGLHGGIKITDFCLTKFLTDKQGIYIQQKTPNRTYNFSDVLAKEESEHKNLYTSPEQLSGKSFGNKVDVFAVGMILYEMLHVFSSDEDRIQQLAKIRPDVTSQRFFLSHSTEHFSEFDLIGSMIDAKPEDRLSCERILEGTLIQDFLKSQPQIIKIP